MQDARARAGHAKDLHISNISCECASTRRTATRAFMTAVQKALSVHMHSAVLYCAALNWTDNPMLQSMAKMAIVPSLRPSVCINVPILTHVVLPQVSFTG